MSNPNVLNQRPLTTSNVTTVVKLVMSKVNVPFNVVTTVTKLVTFPKTVQNQESQELHMVTKDKTTTVELVTSVVV